MPETSSRLKLPYIQPSQAQKHVTHNEAIELLDVMTQLVVELFDATSPPTTPTAGETYALGAAPTGDWASHPNAVASYTGSGWLFVTPQKGWRACGGPDQELRVWNGTDWIATIPSFDTMDILGVNTTADTTNRFSLSSDASLFNNAGGGHQVKINKAAGTDTASLLFQSGWTGHAEMGLAGDNSFSVKVSADGSAWTSPFKIDPVAGTVTLAPATAVQIDAPITGGVVQTDALDTTQGRLMKTGAFGLGAPGALLTDVSVIDGSIAPGLYQMNGSTVGAPRTWGMQHLIHSRRAAGSGETQLALIEDDGSLFYRSRTSGSWQAWQQVATSAHYTGNLSSADSQPIFERGTNINGDYTRFADGTQICWHQIPLTFIWERELYGSWTFPAAFNQAAKVFCSIEFYSLLTTSTAEVDAISTVTTEGATSTGGQFRLMRAAGQTGFASGDSVTVTTLAFGRWK